MKKVMFVASSGGHLSELLKLEPLFNEYDYVIVTEKTSVTEKLVDKYNIEFVKYGSRYYFFSYIYIFLFNVLKSIQLLFKYKPKTIVTTGAHTGGIMCILGKILGCKIIYIESLAKAKNLSMTGKNVYLFADKFYVQWQTLADKYKKAEYIGRLM